MFVLSLVLFFLAATLSLLLLALGLPGTWVLLAGILLAVGVSPQAVVTGGMVLLLCGLGVLAEIAEWVCGVFGARRYGVSAAGVWGSIVGGFLGAIAAGSAFPVIGAVPGGFLGSFLGAFGVELARGAGRREALRLGFGAFIARMLALIAKVGVALAMASLGFFWLV